MKSCKRVEIVIEQALARRLAAALDDAGVPGYTLIRNASGRGDRGMREADEVTDTFTNCVFVIACEASLVEPLVERIRPMLVRSGGLCLVSDASWVRH